MSEWMSGVIRGSGHYELDALEEAHWTAVDTPWGRPSDDLLIGRLHAAQFAFLPRHGRGDVALGLTRYDRSLFADIAWSTAAVADQTIERIQSLGWPLTQGATLRDIDVPADLEARAIC